MMSPERTSRTRYFARRIPRIDFVRIAIRPTRKFNAATRKNETTAETRNIRSAAIEAGGCTGKRSAMTIPIGSVKSAARKADWPAASKTMTVWKFTGRIRFIARRPSWTWPAMSRSISLK